MFFSAPTGHGLDHGARCLPQLSSTEFPNMFICGILKYESTNPNIVAVRLLVQGRVGSYLGILNE